MVDNTISPHPCRWCGGEVKKPRRTWCSDHCVAEFSNRHHQESFRQFVFQNDRGFCRSCRLDCGALEKLLASLVFRSDIKNKILELFEMPDSDRVWQADHILPRELGGEELDPRVNGQVLCHRCHKHKTKNDIVAIKEFKKVAA